ncbi:MAG: FHA domain-containing protein [Betaproteobacteria bacterium]|nr:FHA domain-containing protein [Betaproteobacteria bacterium]
MAKLILSLEGSVIREVPLNKERVTIGRKPQNDIQIENLAVSGEHARIMTILNDSFLEDLGSTNGTLVNGNPIKKHILQDSDVIEIGKYKLKFVMEAPAAQPAEAASMEDFEKTMILRAPAAAQAAAKAFGDTQGMQAAAAAAPAVAVVTPTPGPAAPAVAVVTPPKPVEEPAVAAIQILNGPSAGRELVFTKSLTTLGKAGVQVAVIARRPQGYFITHVEGAKFPVVNGKTLDAQAHPLKDHDVIELAGVKMEFYLKRQ